MDWDLFFEEIKKSKVGKDEVARHVGYGNYKYLRRSTYNRKTISLQTFLDICNLIERHPATFLKYSPISKKND